MVLFIVAPRVCSFTDPYTNYEIYCVCKITLAQALKGLMISRSYDLQAKQKRAQVLIFVIQYITHLKNLQF